VESATHLLSRMYLVDLAGSEMARRTKAEGLVLQQACYVNKRLTILSNMISALAEKRPHVQVDASTDARHGWQLAHQYHSDVQPDR
jgi:hypothetical protein